MLITKESIVSRNETSFLANPVGDEIIILNMETGNYLGLNSVGAAIWDQMQERKSVQEIIDHLASIYEVEAETCAKETLEYLEKIHELGLIQIEA